VYIDEIKKGAGSMNVSMIVDLIMKVIGGLSVCYILYDNFWKKEQKK